MGNKNLIKAYKAKNDEFYTRIEDIERELGHYKDHFKDKVIFCNCDDPYESNFFKYFAMNFNYLGLKKLIATSYKGSPIMGEQLSLFDVEPIKFKIKDEGEAYKIVIEEVKDLNNDGAVDLVDVETLIKNHKNTLTLLEGDGDFRSKECIELLKEADIVVTNPPFSLFREYVAQLIEYDKKFLIIGNNNAITYKEIFPLLKDEKMWLGYSSNKTMTFEVPEHYPLKEGNGFIENGKRYVSVPAITWYTNLEHTKRHEKLILFREYNEEDYPKYDNYNAINVDKVSEIPVDYYGVMGVPITFLDKHNPEQFKILGRADANIANENNIYHIPGFQDKGGAPLVNGKFKYKRILIQRVDQENSEE